MTRDVSVILCTQNGHSKGFLRDALHSVLEQSVPPAELILVDDHSSDGTADWVRRNIRHVKVLTNSSVGLAAARNTGVKEAVHGWIAFIDDDDVWLPGKLAQQLDQASSSPRPDEMILMAQAVAMGEKNCRRKNALYPPYHYSSWPTCLLGSPATPSGAMISRALLRRVGLFDEKIRIGSAYQYWIRCLLSGAAVRYSERVLFKVRSHQAQMTGRTRRSVNAVDCDRMIMPFIKMLPPDQAERIRAARLLTNLRHLAWWCDVRAAVHYWINTPLRPGRFGPHVFMFSFLNTAACLLPRIFAQDVRIVANRFLFGIEPAERTPFSGR